LPAIYFIENLIYNLFLGISVEYSLLLFLYLFSIIDIQIKKLHSSAAMKE